MLRSMQRATTHHWHDAPWRRACVTTIILTAALACARDSSAQPILQTYTEGAYTTVAGNPAIAQALDLDGDGVREIVLGEYQDATGGFQAGRVAVLAGSATGPMYTYIGS
jgi:hypothetical protein